MQTRGALGQQLLCQVPLLCCPDGFSHVGSVAFWSLEHMNEEFYLDQFQGYAMPWWYLCGDKEFLLLTVLEFLTGTAWFCGFFYFMAQRKQTLSRTTFQYLYFASTIENTLASVRFRNLFQAENDMMFNLNSCIQVFGVHLDP